MCLCVIATVRKRYAYRGNLQLIIFDRHQLTLTDNTETYNSLIRMSASDTHTGQMPSKPNSHDLHTNLKHNSLQLPLSIYLLRMIVIVRKSIILQSVCSLYSYLENNLIQGVDEIIITDRWGYIKQATADF